MPPRKTGRKVPSPLIQVHPSAIKTNKYTLPNLHNHWKALYKHFSTEYADWIAVFDKIINLASQVRRRLEGRRKLADNCTYLILTKAMNHSIAAYTLLEKGLLIDAALSTRNAVETLLMLELFATDATNKYFEAWAAEKEFSPSDVRKKLASLRRVEIGDVIFDFTDGHYEGAREIYSFLSKITHANLASLRHSVSKEGEQNYKVFMGGSLDGQDDFVHMMFRILCQQIMSTIITCAVVFDLPFFETHKGEFEQLSKKIKQTTPTFKDQP